MIAYLEVNKIIDVFCLKFFIITLIISVFSAILLTLISKKYLQILQQSSYRKSEFLVWKKRKPNTYNTRLVVLSILSILFYVLTVECFAFLKISYFELVALVIFPLFVLIYLWGDKKRKDKCSLIVTNRVKRLIACFFVVNLLVSFVFITIINLLFYFVKDVAWLSRIRLCLTFILPVFLPQILLISNGIISPIEKSINKKYIQIAKNKLQSLPEIIKIGITGSYGKTSVKNILNTILSVKYKVLATPKSFNTPMGVSIAVKDLDSSFDVFICEMGARYVGDIKELCDIVGVKYGVITGITNQHLETFKSIENIKKTKAELIQNVSDLCVISSDSAETLSLKNGEYSCQVITAGVNDGSDIFAQDIKITESGSEFTLNFDGVKVKTSTKLLGAHSVSNIVLASALCYKMGMTAEEICQGIAKIKPTPHRLELVENDKNVTIIDDSYNANIVGARASVDFVKSFGKRTIVITPGIVELGKLEKIENIEFGKQLSVCDIVILVGTTCAYNVREGLFLSNFNFDNLYMVKTLDEAKEKLSELVLDGDVVLFENDLPDRYL